MSRVEQVTVSVRKLRPPVAFDMRSAGVCITRAAERVRAFVGLGSNMGDRLELIRRAVAGLPDVVAVSPLYETEPVGGPPGQGPYLNAVVELNTPKSPRQLLEIAGRLESEADRLRAEKDGPRTLDVDILLVGDLSVDEADLVGSPSPYVGEAIRPRPSGRPGAGARLLRPSRCGWRKRPPSSRLSVSTLFSSN